MVSPFVGPPPRLSPNPAASPHTRAVAQGGALRLRAVAPGRQGDVSRRRMMAGVASLLVSAGASVKQAGAEDDGAAAAEGEAPKVTVYGQDAMQLLKEGAVTGLGFFIVLLPTILRTTGVLETSKEDLEKYPSRLWTIDNAGESKGPSAPTGGEAEAMKKAQDDASGGKSL
mmetsp:Transcript_27513/g.66340  ORF Transcript_27513/g.66340 Transcript_27513/m.66340 type:complete len:171 (-) Transcript_27513:65-577(-)